MPHWSKLIRWARRCEPWQSNKEIADDLFISINTVVTHRKNIAKKINIHSSAALVLYAIMNNIITTEQVRSAKKQDK